MINIRKERFFEQVFKKNDDSHNRRIKQNYLSRLFSLFYERIVPIWCENNEDYDCLTEQIKEANFPKQLRPSIYSKKGKYLHQTYDFVFKRNDKFFLVEQKNWISYRNFRFYEMDKDNIDEIVKELPERFKKICAHNQDNIVKVNRKKIQINGVILIWSSINPNHKDICKRKLNVNKILSFEKMVYNVRNVSEFKQLIEQYRSWSNVFFDDLTCSS